MQNHIEEQPTLNTTRSSRVIKRPSHLKDYYCTNVAYDHWCGIVKHKALTAINRLEHSEHSNHKIALLNPKWKKAMDQEIFALE